MKKMFKVMLALMLAVLMLASSVSASAAAKPVKTVKAAAEAAQADTEVVELNWEDFEGELTESGLEGDFYVLNAVAAEFWVSELLEQTELSDEDAEQGLIAYFSTEEEDYGFFVTYVDGQGITLEEYAEQIAEDEDYDELEYLCINGLDAIAFCEHDEEMEMDFEYVSFVTEGGYVLTFTYWDVADEDYMGLVTVMVASIQPEEE